MNIQPINNVSYNTSFKGIKLSTDNFEQVREIVQKLMFQGIHCVGHKSFTINNNIAEKRYIVNYMKNNHPFPQDEFGVIFFPFSHEAYIVADRLFEQQLLKKVQKVDKKAKINLMI